MKENGYARSERGRETFKKYYSAYKADRGLYSFATARGGRLEELCSAIAHLETSKYMDYEGDAAYDIRGLWGLTDDEYKIVAETFSSDLKGYHLEDAGVPSKQEVETAIAAETVKDTKKFIRILMIITACLMVVFAVVFFATKAYCESGKGYQKVDAVIETIEVKPIRKLTGFDCTINVNYNGKTYPIERITGDYVEAVSDKDAEYLTKEKLERLSEAYKSQEPVSVYMFNDKIYLSETFMNLDRPVAKIRHLSLIALGYVFAILLAEAVAYVSITLRGKKYTR